LELGLLAPFNKSKKFYTQKNEEAPNLIHGKQIFNFYRARETRKSILSSVIWLNYGNRGQIEAFRGQGTHCKYKGHSSEKPSRWSSS